MLKLLFYCCTFTFLVPMAFNLYFLHTKDTGMWLRREFHCWKDNYLDLDRREDEEFTPFKIIKISFYLSYIFASLAPRTY